MATIVHDFRYSITNAITKTKVMYKLMVMMAICLALAGCTSKKELSREEAFQLLKKEMGYPKVYPYDIFCADPEYAKKVTDAGLENEGLLSVKRTRKISELGQPLVEFSGKATPYLLTTSEADKKANIRKVKLADEELIAVTGVTTSDDGKKAEAKYIVGYKNITPFASLVRTDLQKQSSRTAYLTLSDDGWRLERQN